MYILIYDNIPYTIIQWIKHEFFFVVGEYYSIALPATGMSVYQRMRKDAKRHRSRTT